MSQQKTIPERSAIPQPDTWNTADLYPTGPGVAGGLRPPPGPHHPAGGVRGPPGRERRCPLRLFDPGTGGWRASGPADGLRPAPERRGHPRPGVPGHGGPDHHPVCGAVPVYRLRGPGASAPLRPDAGGVLPAGAPGWSCSAGISTTSSAAGPTLCPTARERLLAAAGELAQSPDDIFSKLSDADLTFPDAVDGQGGRHPLSNGSFTPAHVQ